MTVLFQLPEFWSVLHFFLQLFRQGDHLGPNISLKKLPRIAQNGHVVDAMAKGLSKNQSRAWRGSKIEKGNACFLGGCSCWMGFLLIVDVVSESSPIIALSHPDCLVGAWPNMFGPGDCSSMPITKGWRLTVFFWPGVPTCFFSRHQGKVITIFYLLRWRLSVCSNPPPPIFRFYIWVEFQDHQGALLGGGTFLQENQKNWLPFRPLAAFNCNKHQIHYNFFCCTPPISPRKLPILSKWMISGI